MLQDMAIMAKNPSSTEDARCTQIQIALKTCLSQYLYMCVAAQDTKVPETHVAGLRVCALLDAC